MPSTRLILLLNTLLLAGPTLSARTQAAAEAEPSHPALRLDEAELEIQLAGIPVLREGKKRFLKRGPRRRILGAYQWMPIVADNKSPLVLRIDRGILRKREATKLLDDAFALARTHLRGDRSPGWSGTVYWDEFLGLHIDLGESLLRPDGSRIQKIETRARDADPKLLRQIFAQFYRDVTKSALGGALQRSLLQSVRAALDFTSNTEEDKRIDAAYPASAIGEDDVPPVEFTAELVASGALQRALPASRGLAKLEDLLQTMRSLRADVAWHGKAYVYSYLGNELGASACVEQSAKRTRVMTSQWIQDDQPACTLIYELPPRCDPDSIVRVQRAELRYKDEKVLSWARDGKLVIHARAAWDRLTKPKRRELRGWLPPHIPLVSISGRVYGIVTQHGLLTAPGVEDSGRAWIQRAARLLPDPWHLDLVRRWFFRYIFDSPDPTRPLLPGTEGLHGDIHQTVDETLANCNLGRMCGDCDDLAEVFQELHRAQGGLGHVLSVPGHAAYGFIEKKGRLWYAQTLHTYEPVRYRARSRDAALTRLYGFFNPGAKIETQQLSILLRFAGENRRDTWRLSSRIFEDREYADAMIDLQRDWHRHAYARGTQRMARRIEAGDTSFADRMEYAGLLERSGRWLKAARALQAMEKAFGTKSSEVGLRKIANYFEAGDNTSALTSAEEYRKTYLASLGRGKEQIDATMNLVSALAAECRDPRVAELLLAIGDAELTGLRAGFKQTAGWLKSPQFRKQIWQHSPFHKSVRIAQRIWVDVALRLLESLPETHPAWKGRRKRILDESEFYLRAIMPFDMFEAQDRLMRYAHLGEFLRVVQQQPQLDAQVARAKLPQKPGAKPAPRGPLRDELRKDLAWLRICLPWYVLRIEDRIDRAEHAQNETERRSLLDDRALAAELARADTAWSELQALYPGLTPYYFHLAHVARYSVALLRGDEALQRSVLRTVKAKGDKFLTDSVVACLGRCSPVLEAARWRRALQLYAAELDYLPLWFEIAWGAVREGAHAQALLAAELACETHPDVEFFRFERDAIARMAKKHSAKDERSAPARKTRD